MKNIPLNERIIFALDVPDAASARLLVEQLDSWMTEYQTWKEYVMRSIQKRFDELLDTLDSIAFQKMDVRLEKFFMNRYKTTGITLFKGSHQDVAQAMGARYRGKRTGTLGTAGCFSFFPSKNLGAFGDGGAVASADSGILKKVRMLANHGRMEKYTHEMIGTNSRLDTLKAAQLSICLDYLDEWNSERRKAAALYHELLEPFEEIGRPGFLPESEPIWHVYVIRYGKRDELAAFLESEGIRTGLHYPLPLHFQPSRPESPGLRAFPPAFHGYAARLLPPGSFSPTLPYPLHQNICMLIRVCRFGKM